MARGPTAGEVGADGAAFERGATGTERIAMRIVDERVRVGGEELLRGRGVDLSVGADAKEDELPGGGGDGEQGAHGREGAVE